MIDIISSRKESSDLCWILKDYESTISFFNHYKPKELLKKSVLESMDFKYDMKLLADKSEKSESELVKNACSILDGMSHNLGMNSIRFMGYTLSKIIKQIYHSIFVNDIQIEKIRDALTHSYVILLPTHRSYADFLLMSYVMFYFNLPMPVVAAAMDFMNMKLVGELLRGCGAFFIKRSFASDDLYWTVFSNYIKALIKLEQEPLEFFVEGTRSRTNKSLYPKIGLLGIVLELWLSNFCDVTIIPISISYDRLLEEKLYAWELLGVPKPKESTSGLLKVRHILKENYGNIYFNISDPISISKLAETHGISRFHHNLQLRFKPSLFDNEKRFLRHLASLIVQSQQQSSVLCDVSILILIMLHSGISDNRKITPDKLEQLYKSMTNVLTVFGANLGARYVSQESYNESVINRVLLLHSQSFVKSEDGIALIGCQAPLHTDKRSPEQLNSLIVDRIHLGNCRNPALFYLARESILLSRMRHGQSTNVADITKDFELVLDLFGREFIYSDSGQSSFNSAMARLNSSDLLNNVSKPNTEHPCYFFVESAVHVHLTAYVIYGHVILTVDRPVLNAADLCKFVQSAVIGLCAKFVIFGHLYLEMCSLDMIRNFVGRYNDILKSHSIDHLKQSLVCLENCLPAETRKQLLEAYMVM